MGFERLRFFNFRNLKDTEIVLGKRDVFLVGQNGQGKTNLLEAIHLLCLGSSFREKREGAFPRDPSLAMGLHGVYSDPASGRTSLSLQCAPGQRKEIQVDDKPLTERRDLLSRVLCISLVQQDMDYIIGSPEDRRRFFDQTMVLSDLSFIDTLRAYRQVLKSRNICLRQDRDDLLDAYDAQLASYGLALQGRREEVVREFNAVFDPLFQEITGADQTVSIRYRPSWEGLSTTDEIMGLLASRRERDRLTGVTSTGPHRDSCAYMQEGRDYSHFASTGQLRLCALSLRVAQARFLTARTGRAPVLLLDDVLLELDPGSKRAFLSHFPPYEQALFTFLPDESWQSYASEDTLVLTVEAGEFRG